MERIIMHWSAGTYAVSALDRQHYHFIVDGTGAVVAGIYPPEANDPPRAGKYAAHTLNCNTGSIGVAVAAMAGAVESPFDAGRHPITDAQVAALAALCARLCKRYNIPVTPRTVLSHAEVQPTLGIAQRQKWDISWLPGMAKPSDPVAVGDELRAQIALATGSAQTITTRRTIRRGSSGDDVMQAQKLLTAKGYDTKGADGAFGPNTETAAIKFQKARQLVPDGIIGAATWAALEA